MNMNNLTDIKNGTLRACQEGANAEREKYVG